MANGEPQAGDVIAGKYRIDGPIGRGGMGVVLGATHVLTQRRLAVKWMLPELAEEAGAVERFLREARASAKIDHPNVVRVYDVGQHDGSLFMVMELLEGEPLSALLERGALDPATCVSLLLPVIRGVGAAHAQGIIHRDIKPDNVFLCRDARGELGDPKVLDFGISKLTEGVEPGSHTLTGTHTVLGTPYYMSKEQMTRSKGVDQRTDIYALGVVLYQALTGDLPFHGDTYGALAVAIATETPRPVRELRPLVSPGLAAVVEKAMAREVDDRYTTIADLVAALGPYTGDAAEADPALALAATEPSRPGVPRITATSTPMGTEARDPVPGVTSGRGGALMVVAGLAVAAAAAVALWPRAEPDTAPTTGVMPTDAAPAATAAPNDEAATHAEATAPEEKAAKPDAGVATAAAEGEPEPAPAPSAAPEKAARPQPAARPAKKRVERPRRTKRRATPTAEATPAAAPPKTQPATPTAPTPAPKRKARAGDMSLDDFL